MKGKELNNFIERLKDTCNNLKLKEVEIFTDNNLITTIKVNLFLEHTINKYYISLNHDNHCYHMLPPKIKNIQENSFYDYNSKEEQRKFRISFNDNTSLHLKFEDE